MNQMGMAFQEQKQNRFINLRPDAVLLLSRKCWNNRY